MIRETHDAYLQFVVDGSITNIKSAAAASIPKDISSEFKKTDTYLTDDNVNDSTSKINGISLRDRVLANRNKNILEPTSKAITQHFNKLSLLDPSLDKFNNTSHPLYKFYNIISDSDPDKYNIYLLMKSIINNTITEYDIIEQITKQNLIFDIDGILAAYNSLDPATILSSKTKKVYEKLSTNSSVIAIQELKIHDDINDGLKVISRYKDENFFYIPPFYEIFKLVYNSDINSEYEIFYPNLVTEDNLLNTIETYQIKSKDFKNSEFEVAKKFYTLLAEILNNKDSDVEESTNDTMFNRKLNDIYEDLNYIPYPWRILTNSSGKEVILNQMRSSSVSIRDNLVHPLLYQSTLKYDFEKAKLLLQSLDNSIFTIDINSFHDMLLLVSSVCVEFIDAYNTFIVEQIQSFEDLKNNKKELLLDPNNTLDKIITLQKDISKLDRLAILFTDEIISYSALPDNVFFLDAFLLLIDTDYSVVSTLNEVKLVSFLYAIYNYFYKIADIIDTDTENTINDKYQLWSKLFSNITVKIKEIQSTCINIYNGFINDTNFRLSSYCRNLVEGGE